MSSLLNIFGNNNQLGVDIGQSSVKICELIKAGKGKYQLKNFSYSYLTESAIFEEEISNRSEVVEALRHAYKKGAYKSKDICLGLSGSSCVVKTMKAPDGSKEDIEDFISWEAEQFIPFGVENAEISMHILDKSDGGNRDVIMAAAKVSTIEEYETIVNNSGLKIKTLDLQVLSLVNAFEYNYLDNLEEYAKGTLIIDFGSQTTKVLIYKDGSPLFAKSILLGGINATEEIQKSVGLDFLEAEDLKQTKSSDGNAPDEVLSAIRNIVDTTVMKVLDAITFYTRVGSEDKIRHCFITGGNLQLPGVIEGLSEKLDLSIEIFDPVRRLKVSKKISDEDLEYLTYSGAAAIGLALRSFD